MKNILQSGRDTFKALSFIISLSLAQLLLSAIVVQAQLTVQGGFTPAQIVNTLLGPNVTVSNITYTGDPAAIGLFNGTSSNIGLAQGVLITSGDIIYAPGPNTLPGAGIDNLQPGDADLTVLAGTNTFNAAILEFDFTVPSDTIKFHYVFASEEYNEYVCADFNDIFAFYISGPGIIGTQNIALIPGTASPVSINNVNNGTAGAFGGTAPCNLGNAGFFIDNDNPPGLTVEYDGFTVVLEASAAVIPCSTYHIKLAIADAFDGVFDSGVFLEEGSFSGTTTTAAAAPSPPIGCAPLTVNFSNSSVGASLYAWNFDDGSPVDSSQSPSHLFLNPGTYNVQLIATGALACGGISDTTYVTVTVTTNLPVDLGPDTALCSGTSMVLGYGIIPGTSYTWSTGETSSFIVITTPGTYWVDVTSSLCPAGSDTINVGLTTVNVDLGNDTTICPGQSVTLGGNLTGTSFAWSTGASTSAITVSTPGAYWVVVTSNGCQGVDTIQVVAFAASVNLGNDTTLCPGQSLVLGNNLTGNAFSWSTGATTSTINVTAPGTYWVNVVSAGCQASDTILVNMGTSVAVNLGSDTTLCAGNIVVLNAGTHQSYQWSTGSTSATISVTSSGVYTVSVNDGGCFGSDSVSVQFISLPVVNLGPDAGICQGQTVVLDAGNAGASYLWSDGSTAQTITVNSTGNFAVTVTASGCSASGNINITVNSLPQVIITPDTSLCSGSSVNLNASGGVNYAWSPPSGLSNAGIPNPVAQPSSTTTYVVAVTDANFCSSSGIVTVTVNPLPAISTIADVAICEGNSVTLTAQGGVSYVWTPTAGLNDASSSAPVATPVSSTLYQVTGTDANGCTNTDQVNVAVAMNPSASFMHDFETTCEGTVGTFTNSSVNATQYIWNFGDGTASSDINPVHNFGINSLNTVTLIALNGNCSDTLIVTNLDGLSLNAEIPDVFTPNTDQHNDCYQVKSLAGYENCFSIKIFNRWGNTVFESNKSDSCWDGTISGSKAPAGTYFYVLIVAGKKFNGSIQLIR